MAFPDICQTWQKSWFSCLERGGRVGNRRDNRAKPLPTLSFYKFLNLLLKSLKTGLRKWGVKWSQLAVFSLKWTTWEEWTKIWRLELSVWEKTCTYHHCLPSQHLWCCLQRRKGWDVRITALGSEILLLPFSFKAETANARVLNCTNSCTQNIRNKHTFHQTVSQIH